MIGDEGFNFLDLAAMMDLFILTGIEHSIDQAGLDLVFERCIQKSDQIYAIEQSLRSNPQKFYRHTRAFDIERYKNEQKRRGRKCSTEEARKNAPENPTAQCLRHLLRGEEENIKRNDAYYRALLAKRKRENPDYVVATDYVAFGGYEEEYNEETLVRKSVAATATQRMSRISHYDPGAAAGMRASQFVSYMRNESSSEEEEDENN